MGGIQSFGVQFEESGDKYDRSVYTDCQQLKENSRARLKENFVMDHRRHHQVNLPC